MRKLLALIGCCLLLAASSVRAQDVGKVEGTLTYEGKSIKLDHVLVVRYGDEEELEQGPRLRVILADGEIPLKLSGGPTLYDLRDALYDGGVHAVLLSVPPGARGKGVEMRLLTAPGMPRLMSIASGVADFQRFVEDSERVSGTVAFKASDLEVLASFNAPVMENSVTADLKGEAARQSAPGVAFLAVGKALETWDMESLKHYLSPANMEEIRGATKADMEKLKLAGKEVKVWRVVIRGERAVVMNGVRIYGGCSGFMSEDKFQKDIDPARISLYAA